MPLPVIHPPLLNSASPWATTEADLQALFDCPHTGAITTRTSLLRGFEHDNGVHQYTFFTADNQATLKREGQDEKYVGSLNTLGYSPIRLDEYLSYVQHVVKRTTLPKEVADKKCCIISVTGSAEAVVECYELICATQDSIDSPLAMEVNLSCPNIPGKPPPAYSAESLSAYLQALKPVRAQHDVPIGLKTPPYTYHGQFETLISALLGSRPGCPVDFLTATNTLGSSLVLDDTGSPAIQSASGAGIGGMAGAPLHALSLGNVKTLRGLLDEHQDLRAIDIIGVGGVSDAGSVKRMQAVGAKAVALATALGQQGIQVFERIIS